MSDVVQISRLDKVPAPERLELPHRVQLPTRYYSRAAVEETARAFAGIATVESRVGDGVIHLAFSAVDEEAGEAREVIDEFLNHALYASATSGEEAGR